MNDNQQKFADMVQQNKSTIYTVCYMFSKDQDEVNDLFQEVLIRLWQGFANFEGRSDVKPDLPCGAQHVHHAGPKETTPPQGKGLHGR